MDIKSAFTSFARMIRDPGSPEFSAPKKVISWALSILFYFPPLFLVHIACWKWNVKHAPSLNPEVTQKAQEVLKPTENKRDPEPSEPKTSKPPENATLNLQNKPRLPQSNIFPIPSSNKPDMPSTQPYGPPVPPESDTQDWVPEQPFAQKRFIFADPITGPKEDPLKPHASLEPHPVPAQPAPSIIPQEPKKTPSHTYQTIDTSDLKNSETAQAIVAQMEKSDTVFLLPFYQYDENYRKAFEKYRTTSNDLNLSRKGAYILVQHAGRFDHTVFHHYLIKLLQEKGMDVYFVVTRGQAAMGDSRDRPFCKFIQIEGDDRAWHPYFLSLYTNVKNDGFSMEVDIDFREVSKNLPELIEANKSFKPIPKILGWSKHARTFAGREDE